MRIGFLGTYEHTLDSKGRVQIPARFRSALDQGLVLTKGPDGQLLAFTVDGFERYMASTDDLPTHEVAARKLREWQYAGCRDLELDGQGRILIPADLRAFAGLNGQARFVGSRDRIAVWNPARHDAFIAEVDANPAQFAQMVGARM